MIVFRLFQGGEVIGRVVELVVGFFVVRGNFIVLSNCLLFVDYFGVLNIIFVLFEYGVL